MYAKKKEEKLVHIILCNIKNHISVSMNLSSQLTIVMVKQKNKILVTADMHTELHSCIIFR